MQNLRLSILSVGIPLAAILALTQVACSAGAPLGSPEPAGQAGSGMPRTTSKSGKDLLAVVGQPAAKVAMLCPVQEGGFNASDEKHQKAIPFGIKGFEYDMWRVETSSQELAKGLRPVGAHFNATVYGIKTNKKGFKVATHKEVFENLGFDISEWQRGSWFVYRYGKTMNYVADGDLYACNGYFIGISRGSIGTFVRIWKSSDR